MKKKQLNEQDLAVLRTNPLFKGLEQDRFERQLQVMKAEKATGEKGEMLQAIGEPIRRFGIVLSGAVQVCVDDIEGNRMIMAEVAPGNSFGESLCFLRTKESPVYIFASEDSELLWLSTEELFAGSDAFYREIQHRFTATLAGKALTMNNRIQVLSRLSLRGKLTAYFTELAAAQGSDVIRLPMNREDTAAYIGANRSALSRELARMRNEGLIDYRKNEIRILR
ncbi:MAG: Crp/Fnr family transcriptional regulator [Clostridiales bacterium]|nr:Crp/Fnr family transcriptional regulator [Clostridiales bacterium]